MFFNPFLFFLARPPNFIIWDYKSHKQYELNSDYAERLLTLIYTPESFDCKNPIDSDFLANNVISTREFPPDNWGWDELSKIFHIGTKNIPCERRPENSHDWAHLYHEHCQSLLNKPSISPIKTATSSTIELSRDFNGRKISSARILEMLIKRKTCRVFEKKPISMEDLSSILYFSFGYLKERENDSITFIPPEFRPRRSSPSGGGLNASEAYVYVNRIKGIPPGLYYYDPASHGLSFIRILPMELGELLEGQHFINDIPFGIFLISRFDRMWWKYEHSRAYRVSLLEIGHLSQTFQLLATATGMKTWLTAALSDKKVEEALGITNFNEQPILFVGAGYSKGEVFSQELSALLMKGAAHEN